MYYRYYVSDDVSGISPIVLTIIVAVLTTIVTLGLLGGYSSKTVSAILGTAIGVVIAAVAAMAFGKAAGITGYNVSDIEALNYVGQNTKIKIGELLFAGIIISSIGAVMDVGMSIASTIQEIYETDKTLSMKRLFVSGINVWKDNGNDDEYTDLCLCGRCNDNISDQLRI